VTRMCYVCINSEQRVTGILVFVMVGLSALMADLLKVLSVLVHFIFSILWVPLTDIKGNSAFPSALWQ